MARTPTKNITLKEDSYFKLVELKAATKKSSWEEFINHLYEHKGDIKQMKTKFI